ncbi:MAG: ABC transporter ATP-binding protein [Dehalococcoidales bacterium]|nr:ABC transporter ATP-binding protein [Dehalococcoidales bacterium]
MSPIIESKKLSKMYARSTVVDDLNLSIDEGQIYGFLGPNGAGKTTTILMLMGLTQPTRGEAYIGGFNSTREPLKVKRITGYIPEKVGFYEDLSASYNLLYTARLNGLPEKKAYTVVSQALEKVGLEEQAGANVSTFSKGMKQRLAIADILVKSPKVAFLDEPTSGIDPAGIAQMLDLISQIARENKMTIVMSSHQLNQVERICSHVGIMSKGKLVVEGSLDQLSKKAGGNRTVIDLQLSEVSTEIVEGIRNVQGVLNIEQKADLLIITCLEDMRRQISKVVQEKNGLIVQMKLQSFALEDIYLKYFKEG